MGEEGEHNYHSHRRQLKKAMVEYQDFRDHYAELDVTTLARISGEIRENPSAGGEFSKKRTY